VLAAGERLAPETLLDIFLAGAGIFGVCYGK